MALQYTIRGQVVGSQQETTAGLRVEAYDRDLRSWQSLGQAEVDSQHRFEIVYTSEQFRHADNKSADVVVRVSDIAGALLPIRSIAVGGVARRDPSAPIFNAPEVLDLAIVVDFTATAPLSEYERYVALITPILDGLRLADLTRDDLDFIAGDLELAEGEPDRINVLRAAAAIALDNAAPVEAFYAWGRMKIPDLWGKLPQISEGEYPSLLHHLPLELAALPDDKLISALKTAALQNVVPGRVATSAAAILLLLRRTIQNRYPITGQLLDDATGEALDGLRVVITDADGGGRQIGADVTDGSGKFTFDVYLGEKDAEAARTFLFSVTNADGNSVHVKQTVQPSATTVTAMSLALPWRKAAVMTDLQAAGALDIDKNFLGDLANNHEIHTFADVRRKGGFGFLTSLAGVDTGQARKLAALADLDRLSNDVPTTSAFLKAGYDGVLAVASAPLAKLEKQVQRIKSDLTSDGIKKLHLQALGQTAVLDTVLTGIAKGIANVSPDFHVLAAPGPGAGAAPAAPTGTPLDDLFRGGCACSDCEAATSPAAYLADLLDYAVKHVRNGADPIDIAFLDKTFGQPFSDLPLDCSMVDAPVRQVRICVEVLRQFLGARPLNPSSNEAALAAEEARYRLAAYSGFLLQLGTSYQELRLSRDASDADRQLLADRLGIPLSPRVADPDGDELDRLLLDPAAGAGKPNLLSEDALERLFGLASTLRDPLSTGCKVGDAAGQLTRWRLDGVSWGRNTDADGRIHLSLIKTSPTTFDEFVYMDAGRTKAVASAEISTPAGSLRLIPANNSGLSGLLGIDYTADDTTTAIQSIPQVLVWRLRRLRQAWLAADWPSGGFGPIGNAPLIDPDVIGPSDLAHVEAGDAAFDLWKARFDWLTGQWSSLKTTREAQATPLAGIDEVIRVALSAAAGHPVHASDLLALDTKEKAGNNIAATLPPLGLTYSGYRFLLRVRSLAAAGQEIIALEWQIAYQTLANAQKVRLFDVWRTAEQSAKITLSADFFQPGDEASAPAPATDPSTPAWLATRSARQLWKGILNARMDQQATTITAFASAADSVEQATLPALRDALVAASDADGASISDKADWIASRLAIDTRADGCQFTTRVEQALEALQGMLFALRTSEFPSDSPDSTAGIAGIKAASAGDGRVELFLHLNDGTLWHKTLDDRARWWRSRGFLPGPAGSGSPASDPAVVAYKDGRLELVVQGKDRALWHASYDGQNWSAWQRVDGQLSGNPAAAPGDDGALEVFALRIGDLDLQQRTYDGAKWSPWAPLGVSSSRSPSVASWGKGRIDIIRANPSPSLFQPVHRWWDGAWHEETLDSILGSDCALTTWGAGRLDIFQQKAGQLWHKAFAAGAWSAWESLDPAAGPGVIALSQAPTACSTGTGEIAVFGLRDGAIWEMKFSGGAWSAWTRLTSIDLSLEAPDFDTEWKWIGTYSTWRAAMFAYLFPENLLLPSLRFKKTPVFASIVAQTQSAALDATIACSLGASYGAYLRDVCTLKIQASCQAMATLWDTDSCGVATPREHDLFVLFGVSKSGRLYWSTIDVNDQSGYAQSFWRKVVNPAGRDVVTEIIGAIPSEAREQQGRYIYLFFKVSGLGGRKIQSVRLDLDQVSLDPYDLQTAWSAPKDFTTDLPHELYTLNILPVQNDSPSDPPRLAIHDLGYTMDVYVRAVNRDGDNWAAPGAWTAFNVAPSYMGNGGLIVPDVVRTLEAALSVAGVNWLVYRNGASRRAYPSAGQGQLVDSSGSPFCGARPSQRQGAGAGSAIYVFFVLDGQPVYQQFTTAAAGTVILTVSDLGALVRHSGNNFSQMLAYVSSTPNSVTWAYHVQESGDQLVAATKFQVVPRADGYPEVKAGLSDSALLYLPYEVKSDFTLNAGAPLSVTIYLEEAYYFVRMHLALKLHAAGAYTSALDWYRTVYNYAAPPELRNVYYGLTVEAGLTPANILEQADNWLLDPLNPHLIALTRPYSYTRFTLMRIAQCFLDYADSEFTSETGESLALARLLYTTALKLFNLPALHQKIAGCDALTGELVISPGKDIPPTAAAELKTIVDALSKGGLLTGPAGARISEKIKAALRAPGTWSTKKGELIVVSNDAWKKASVPLNGAAALAGKASTVGQAHASLLTLQAVENTVMSAGVFNARIGTGPMSTLLAPGVPAGPAAPPVSLPAYGFCIPPNPLIQALRRHGELNLQKLRTCRNIAGMQRVTAFYSAATDSISGLPTIGPGGQVTFQTTATLQSTIYRYSALLDRAKQLVQLAQQAEAAMLGALEKRDDKAYTLLRARQDLDVARANVNVQDLRLTQAQDSVQLAELQKDRAVFQAQTYQNWIDAGYLQSETDYLSDLDYLADAQRHLVGVQSAQNVLSSFSMDPVSDIFRGTASAFTVLTNIYAINAINNQTDAQKMSFQAAYERRRQEWQLSLGLAQQDIGIGAQQITLANDQVAITRAEGDVARLQSSNAQKAVDFLNNQFITPDLYDWMSGVLEGTYRFFLQQATAMARLAQTQLAFERQEPPAALIRNDYWSPVSDSASSPTQSANRKGLTGAEQLSQDLTSLDQYAFSTNSRKLQMTKIISLARIAGVGFQKLRETGVLAFSTPMSLFDRDFPGHYLRLIRRVRVSMIALVPPLDGIHATLANTGISRVVIGPDIFNVVTVTREPELVALTSSVNATGLFDLDPAAPDMYMPFEGHGVDMSWEFRLPKAANALEYTTITDVLLTMDYTALDSSDYRQQVIRELPEVVQNDRVLGFRSEFPDAWYDLNNSELQQPAKRLRVTFRTAANDFPPNLSGLTAAQILLYFIRADGMSSEIGASLKFTPKGAAAALGGAATTIDGTISTRRGNAGAWLPMLAQPPIGVWELSLQTGNPAQDDIVKGWFKDQKIVDIMLVISYAGHLPDWPQ